MAWYQIFILILLVSLHSCNDDKKITGPALFEALNSKATGIDFVNKLTPTEEFNIFKYMYFYNGAGVGVGDFDNDGLSDIFFSANQGENKIYLNQGEMKFRDVTKEAKIPQDFCC
jgi:hypothetical protein